MGGAEEEGGRSGLGGHLIVERCGLAAAVAEDDNRRVGARAHGGRAPHARDHERVERRHACVVWGLRGASRARRAAAGQAVVERRQRR